MSTPDSIERLRFNDVDALDLAKQVGVPNRWEPKPSDGRSSDRFAYFVDDERFVVVAGKQEADDVDLAFAYGLTYRGQRQLVLVLPEQCAFSTLQRAPWFSAPACPQVWLHDVKSAHQTQVPSKKDTIAELSKRLKPGQDLKMELSEAATATYLGPRSADVFELVEWATTHQQLDPGHRKGERAWQCMGQKVLSIRGTSGGLHVRAGIHFSDDKKPTEVVNTGVPLTGPRLDKVQALVESGIKDRLSGKKFKKPDEHWLQAVIRREPTLVGVEQPALRELPAWRPRAAAMVPADASASARRPLWGRGYLDLIGVDGHGSLRVVETKLADNQDELLIFQGLDYYIWALAYENVLRDRLGTPRKSGIQVHYVVGETKNGKIHVSRFAAAQANGLDTDVAWRFQTVRNWFHPDGDTAEIMSELLSPRTIPPSE